MLIDWHSFDYRASVPWPYTDQAQLDWERGIQSLEYWLTGNIGPRLKLWAWTDSGTTYQIGVAFRWDRDRSFFMLTWS